MNQKNSLKKISGISKNVVLELLPRNPPLSAIRALIELHPLEPSCECEPGNLQNSNHRNPPVSAIRLLQYVFIPSPWSSGDQARILLVTHFADTIRRKIGPAETRIKVQVPHANCPAFTVCLSTLRPLTHTGYARDAPKQQ